MEYRTFLMWALVVLVAVAYYGWFAGDSAWAVKLIAVAGSGFLVSAVLSERRNR